MTESRFVPYHWLSHHAIYQFPAGTSFMARCKSCGVARDVSRAYLEEVGRLSSLPKIAPRLRCSLCGKKDAELMAGGWEG